MADTIKKSWYNDVNTQLASMVKSVNSTSPDSDGNVSITSVSNATYATSAGTAYPLREGGVRMYMNWSGKSGQPSWLWGGNDGTNMYVYNPSNFSVDYANSSNYANSAGWANSASASVMSNIVFATINNGYYNCSKSGNSNVILPSGGTWAYILISIGVGTSCSVKTASGGSNISLSIYNDGSYDSCVMIAIRVS